MLHGEKGFFLEGIDALATPEEKEANEFAGEALVPPDLRPALLNLRLNARDVINFARRLGVSPGIVVGQLQHYRRIKHGQLNSLKRRFTWED